MNNTDVSVSKMKAVYWVENGGNADISVKVYLKISLIFELTLTLGNGEEEVWANSKWASHFNLCWGLSWKGVDKSLLELCSGPSSMSTLKPNSSNSSQTASVSLPGDASQWAKKMFKKVFKNLLFL